jgi:capsular polysaccharide biosynthesis protein
MYEVLNEASKKSNLNVNKFNFISRKDTQQNGWFNLRYLANEDEVFNSVKSHGFQSVELLNLKMIDKIKLYNKSETIIQQVGSNCFNILFESPNTNNIIITHPYYKGWIPMLKYICDIKNTKLTSIESGIQLLGLNEYPDIYKRVPDQPWTFNDFDSITNLL